MSKIKLGNPPKNFKSIVKIPLLDGSTADVEMLFKYRTKSQYGALIDEVMAESEKSTKAKDKTVQGSIKTATKGNVDYVLKIAEGWDLEEPFKAENIALLDDEYQGAIAAISEAYSASLMEGRAKN